MEARDFDFEMATKAQRGSNLVRYLDFFTLRAMLLAVLELGAAAAIFAATGVLQLDLFNFLYSDRAAQIAPMLLVGITLLIAVYYVYGRLRFLQSEHMMMRIRFDSLERSASRTTRKNIN